MSYQYYMESGSGRSPDLFIATTSGSTPKPNYVDAMVRTIKLLTERGVNADWLMHQGDPHVDDGRNACVAKFLESGAKKFIFIDDDVGWEAGDFLKFITHDRDVVAAIYPKKKDTLDWPVRLLPGIMQAEPDGLLKVENVPTGFLMISRACLEKMAPSAMQFRRRDTGMTPLLFERGVESEGRWGGDYWWGKKWSAMGGEIFIDPELTLTHVGLKTWQGCLGDYLREKNNIVDPYFDKTIKLLQAGNDSPDIWDVLHARLNNPYGAQPAMLAKCYEMAKDAQGPVLETGSGLSSVIMGIAGAEVHALEHDFVWLKKTQKMLDRYGLDNVHLHYCPLQERSNGSVWYGGEIDVPEAFDLVICDGPPRTAHPATRIELWTTFADEIKDADWIIDDANGDLSFYEQGARMAEIFLRSDDNDELFAVVRRPENNVVKLAG